MSAKISVNIWMCIRSLQDGDPKHLHFEYARSFLELYESDQNFVLGTIVTGDETKVLYYYPHQKGN